MLVLAMEFSKGRRGRRVIQTAGRRRERSTSENAVDVTEAATNKVAPSKRSSEVRRSHKPGIRGRPGTLPRKEARRTRRPPSLQSAE